MDPEEVGRALLELIRDPGTVRGAIMVADEHGTRLEPWWRSVTVRRVTSTATLEPPQVPRRTPSQKAEELALRFVAHLRAKEALLGRPITPDDLTPEEYRAFGAEFWRRGEPVSVETMRHVAAIYLNAAAKGAGRDARWTPDGRGHDGRKPKLR